MSWLPESQDRLPLTWWKGQPVYLAAILAIAGVVSMIVTSLLMAADNGIVPRLIFTFGNVVDRGWLWTPVTYVVVNPPSIFFILTSYFFWRFGEEIERHFGRRVFVKLVVGLMLVTPLLLSLIAFAGPREWPAVGIGQLEFGVFLAFATLYPRAKMSLIIATIDVWIMAAVFVGVSALSSIASRNWAALFILAGQVLFAYGYIRYEQGRWTLPSLSFLKMKRNPEPARRLPVPKPKPAAAKSPRVDLEEKVDAILEKIHREGLQSLTEEERRTMELASETLRKDGA